MADLITRQAAIDDFTKWKYQLADCFGEDYSGVSIVESAIKSLEGYPSAQPEHTNSCYTNSWCNNCKEYDTENKCCPRYNRVIKQTLDEVYAHAETEAEARFHESPSAQPEHTSNNDCNGCKLVGCYDTDFPCANCIRKNKDYYAPERRTDE